MDSSSREPRILTRWQAVVGNTLNVILVSTFLVMVSLPVVIGDKDTAAYTLFRNRGADLGSRMPAEALSIHLYAVSFAACCLSCMGAILVVDALLIRRLDMPWGLRGRKDTLSAMTWVVALASMASVAVEAASAVVEHLPYGFPVQEAGFGYDVDVRVGVFCVALVSVASGLYLTCMLGETGLGSLPAFRDDAGTGFWPSRAQGWMLACLIPLVAGWAFFVWVITYGPSCVGGMWDIARVLRDDPTFPYKLPFSWIGLHLGLGRGHTYALSVACSVVFAWFSARAVSVTSASGGEQVRTSQPVGPMHETTGQP